MSSVAGFHYHFYQPPRENPWTGVFDHEWSAWPYHDWNERIAAECYRAMIAVALPDEEGVTLFEPLTQSSFDLGPTLHHWLEHDAPDVDRALGAQVRAVGAERVVVAAPLVHAILPLATRVDARRLVVWGIDDYRARYGASPRGMWLPETAVDLECLELMASEGISYTVVMPTQARRVRDDAGQWREVSASELDTSRAYFVALPSGARMTVVFGHRELSHQVAFGDTLAHGDALADAMRAALPDDDSIVLLVADGETYGHHHRFGDLGVAWATRRLQEHYGLSTTLGQWLEGRTVTDEVQLHEVSAWSCAHGVERWRSACGCVTGEQAGFDLAWRAPLRDALNWLRENAGAALDWELGHHLRVVDDALLDYGKVMAGEWTRSDFVARHQSRELSDDERSRVLEICEAHRNLQFAFTSCAWFFADPGEIETGIALRYAALAIELTHRATGRDFESPFVERLADVRSRRYGVAGRELWRHATAAARRDEVRVAAAAAAHFAVDPAAPVRRGIWEIEFQPADHDLVRVNLTNTLTLRRFTYLTYVELGADLELHVDISDNTMWRRIEVQELPDDFLALIAMSRLVRPASRDVDAAASLLAAALLRRDATLADELSLRALSSAARYVSPLGEAALRRALWAIAARDDAGRPRPHLAELAAALGVVDTRYLSGESAASN